ncbi:MAG: methionine synthase [Dehalococcoidales bacterium]|nr:methionine synthase [Dehalococcoidales bacterium]
MLNTEFNCLPTIIGSMPHKDPVKACALIARYLKDLPAWPQLPSRTFLENMYVQYAEGFPGLVVDMENKHVHIETSKDYGQALEALYVAYLNNNADAFPISEEYAAGLYAFLSQTGLSPRAVKGHVTGPLSWGLTVTDQDKRSILYDDVLGDAVPKLLKLKAAWQEKKIMKFSKDTITFVDEPYMASYGSSVAAGPFSSPDKVAAMIDEVFEGITGLKGIHCCGNTDWSVILKTKLDILNFDTYNYAESLTLYADEVKAFVTKGGCIAWGIIPNVTDNVTRETVATLRDRLEEAMAPFTRNGLKFRDLATHSLLTPSCTLASLTEDGAELALELLTELSEEMRRKYS